jgi:glycosyltransferase involved in cell wall biosynthesis
MSTEFIATIVICTYDRTSLLEKCLKSANNQTKERKSYEIIVVENSLDDEIFENNLKLFKKYANKFIRSKPPGLSIARNLGWREASSNIVIYLDDDAIPAKNWLEEFLKTYEQYPNAYSVGGKVEPLFESEPPEWLTIEMFDYLSVVNYGDQDLILSQNKWLVGANVSFRKEFLKETGGFPEDLGRIGSSVSLLSNDETPLFSKIYKLNKLVIYSGKASVEHLVPKSRLTKTWFRKRVIWQAISDVIKGEKLSKEQILSFKENYINQSKSNALVGRSIFGLLSNETDIEIFPGKFSDEIGYLYMCMRYLIETGSDI